MFKKENLKQRYFNFGLVALALTILAIILPSQVKMLILSLMLRSQKVKW